MEYTKDVVFEINYGQARKKNIFERFLENMAKHRVITAIVSITFMLVVLDFILISSFVQALSALG